MGAPSIRQIIDLSATRSIGSRCSILNSRNRSQTIRTPRTSSIGGIGRRSDGMWMRCWRDRASSWSLPCRVQKFTAAVRATAWFGCASDGTIGWRSVDTCVTGSEPGAFRFPYDIRVSGDRMYVSDTHNARVQIISMKSMDAAGLSGGSA